MVTEEQVSGWTKKKVVFTLLIVMGVLMVAVIAVFYYMGLHEPEIRKAIQDRNDRAYSEEQAKLRAEEETILRADTDGGKTPEETLQMLISRLKAGDIDGASKLFVVPNQEKEKAELSAAFQNGRKEIIIDALKNLLAGTKGCDENGGGCGFGYAHIFTEDTTVPNGMGGPSLTFKKGQSIQESISIKLNQYSQVWKISEW